MANLGGTINRTDLPEEEKGSYDPLPEGWYEVAMTGAELKDTKAGTGKYIKVEYTVIGENYTGRKIWGNLNIQNPSEKAEEIGRRQLNSLMSAVGIDQLEDTDQLVGNDLKIKLKIREAKDGYDASNDVSGFKSLGEKPSQSSTGESSSNKAPWQK